MTTEAQTKIERKPLPKKDEARLDEVAAAFEDEHVAKWAVRYGRKLLKVEKGLRTTPAPIPPEIGPENAAKVAEILGVDPAQHRAAAEKAKVEARKATPPAPVRKVEDEPAAERAAKPDPKPAKSRRSRGGRPESNIKTK